MKYLLSIFALLCVGASVYLLLPINTYRFEHFELFLQSIFKTKWLFMAFFSRLLLGVVLSASVYYLLKPIKQVTWFKYLAFLLLSLPFIWQALFLENIKDATPTYSEKHHYLIAKPQGKYLLCFVSADCKHCKESIKKINLAQKINAKFPTTIIVSYNTEINTFLTENKIEMPLLTISAEQFMAQTGGSFPKFQLINKGKIIKKWSNDEFNYTTLDAIIVL